MKAYLIILFTIMCSACFAQVTLYKQWDKAFGGLQVDALSDVLPTTDNGILLIGHSASGMSGNKSQVNWDSTLTTGDYWIVKLDSNGVKIWDKRFGGTRNETPGNAVETSDGYVISGSSYSGIGGDKSQPNLGSYDYWVIKIDFAGNKIWDKTYGGTLEDLGSSVILCKDNGLLVIGASTSPAGMDKSENNRGVAGNSYDIWIIKLDSVGNKQWDKTLGGSADEFSLDGASETEDNGFLIGSHSDSHISGDKTQDNWSYYSNLWVVKIDSSGNKQWDIRYGGLNADKLKSLKRNMGGNYILAGHSFSDIGGDKTAANIGDADFWVIKIDAFGNKFWDKTYGGTENEEVVSCFITNDNGILLAGRSLSDAEYDKSQNNLGNSQAWVIKTDSSGNKVWDRTLLNTATDYWGAQAVETINGCYILADYTSAGIGGNKTQPGFGGSDYWVTEFCPFPLSIDEENFTNGIGINVYPNPFTKEVSITIHKENLQKANFTLTNATGQVIYTRQETNLNNTYTKMLDLTNLPGGTYFMEVTVGEERIVKQLVK